MFDGVGRRQDQTTGQLVSIGEHSLNGFERDCLFRNNGDGTFTDTAYVNAADRIEDGRGLSVFDYDQDGWVDVLLRNYEQPAQLLRNGGGEAHWIELKLVGTRSNRDAVGARVTLVTGGRRQTREVHAGSGYLSGSSLIQHFGLGQAERVESIEVAWPSGERSRLRDVAADRQLVLVEGRPDAVPVTSWRPLPVPPGG
jgi:enediyne biosynthesis protein E4